MRRIYKNLFILGMAVLILLTPGYSRAIEVINYNDVSPMFTNIRSFSNSLEISKNGISYTETFISARNVDRVSVELLLQQYKNGKWTTIKEWSDSKAGDNHGLSKQWSVASGYSYRLVSYGYVYQGNKLVESTSSTSSTVYY